MINKLLLMSATKIMFFVEIIFLLLCWTLLAPFLLLSLPVILLLFLMRWCEVVVRSRKTGAIRMSREDLLWMMANEQNQQIISGLIEIDGVLNVQEMKNILRERLVNKIDQDGTNIYPQVTMHLESGFLDYFWYPDSEFNISDHVIGEKCVYDDEQLHKIIDFYVSRSFTDSKKSPWEFIVIPFRNEQQNEKTMVLFRLSHAISDGSSLAYFLVHGLSDVCPVTMVSIKKFSQGQKMLFYVKAILWMPLVYLKLLLHQGDCNVITSRRPGHTSKKSLAWSKALPLTLLKMKKNEISSTVNDVAVGCFSKTLFDYIKQNPGHKNLSTNTFSAVFAVDTRSNIRQAQTFRNQIAGVVESLPLCDGESIDDYVAGTKHKFDRMKQIGAPISIYLGWRFMSYLFPLCLLKMFVYKLVDKTTASISNLIGPQNQISFSGLPVSCLTFWPPPSGHQSMGVSFCSYNNCIRMGVLVDSSALGGVETLVELFEKNVLLLDKKV